VDQKILLELFGLRVAPGPLFLVPAAIRSSAQLYGLLRREGMEAGLRSLWLAAEHAVPAQLGVFAAAGMPRLERLSPRLYGRLDRRLSSGT
jgi:hypothetical protein